MYTLLLIKTSENEATGKYSIEVLNQYEISNSIFDEWKMMICNEWEKRVVIEGDKAAEANSRKKSTKEEWEQYFIYMRSDN